MSIGLLYWIIMLIWFLFGLYINRVGLYAGDFSPIGGNLILFILLGLIGWRLFGPPIRNDGPPPHA